MNVKLKLMLHLLPNATQQFLHELVELAREHRSRVENIRTGESWSFHFCCGIGESLASEQQHNQDLRRIYRREYEFSNSSLFARMHCN